MNIFLVALGLTVVSLVSVLGFTKGAAWLDRVHLPIMVDFYALLLVFISGMVAFASTIGAVLTWIVVVVRVIQ
jgi:hypothetical protein